MKRLTCPAQGYCEMYCKEYGRCFDEPETCDFSKEVQMYERLKDYETTRNCWKEKMTMPLIDAVALKNDVRRYVLEGTDEFGTISVEAAERSFLCLIDRQPAIEVEPKWIPVTERLPEEWRKPYGEMVNYLIFAPEFGVDIGSYLAPAKTWLCVGIPCSVTHWKPLPEGPKINGDSGNG